MSFILDALRKSETERQRQSGPGLADAGYRPPARRRGIWLPLLMVVLVANLVLLSLVWLRGGSATAPTVPAATVAPAPPALPAVAPRQTDPGPEIEPDIDYEAIADVPALDPGEPELAPAGARAAGLDAAAEQIAEPPTAPAGTVTDDLPTAAQLMASGALPARPMHLDIHVFSTTPAERFVFINMRKYVEGAQLSEGPQVEEITPEGVVLSENGRRFLLTRD